MWGSPEYLMKFSFLNFVMKKLTRERVVGAAQFGEINAQGASKDHLHDLTRTDALTGLASYGRLSEILKSEIKRSERSSWPVAVLIIETNGMKQINDSVDHQEGDRAICRLADIVQRSCRSIDTAARYGGNNVAIILLGTGVKEADVVARRICERLSSGREKSPLSVSMGFAVYPEDGTTVEALFQSADRALSQTKQLSTALPTQPISALEAHPLVVMQGKTLDGSADEAAECAPAASRWS
jgi:diguanylate cyclase (GGDEF)-like protein